MELCRKAKNVFFLFVIIVAWCFGFSKILFAGEKPLFLIDLSLALEGTYDDNVYQVGVFKQSDFVTRAIPGVSVDVGLIKYLIFNAAYSTQIYYYTKNSNLNEIFHNLDIELGLDFGSFKQKHWRNFRLGTEIDLSPVIISVTNSGDTGINSTQRVMGALIPGYNWRISRLMSLDAEARFQRIIYLDEGFDNTVGHLVLNFKRKILKKINLNLGVQATYQKFDDIGVSKLFGGNVGIDFEVYRRLNGDFSIGYQKILLPNGVPSDSAITLDANLEYLLSKRTSFNINANRTNTIDINGLNFLTWMVSLGGNHRISAQSIVGLSAFYRFAEQDALVNGILLTDNLTSFGTELKWAFTKYWTFGISVIRDKNAGQAFTNDYTGNRFTGEVKYHFPIRFR